MDVTSIPSIFLHLSLFRTLRFHPMARTMPHFSRFSSFLNLVLRLCSSDSSAPKIASIIHPPPSVDRLVELSRCPAPVAEPLPVRTHRPSAHPLLDVGSHPERVYALEVRLRIVSSVGVEDATGKGVYTQEH